MKVVINIRFCKILYCIYVVSSNNTTRVIYIAENLSHSNNVPATCNSEPVKTAFTWGEIPPIVALHLMRLLKAY